MRHAKGHPLAPPSGLVSEARIVLYGAIGPGPHPCHWCGEFVNWAVGRRGYQKGNLVADHLNGDPLNDSIENLVPACGRCNGTRATAVGVGEAHVTRKSGSKLRGEHRACRTCGATFVAVPDPRPGRGLYCSRSCARSAPRV